MFRKLLATALAVGMCFSLGVSAYAEESTVTDATTEQDFEVNAQLPVASFSDYDMVVVASNAPIATYGAKEDEYDWNDDYEEGKDEYVKAVFSLGTVLSLTHDGSPVTFAVTIDNSGVWEESEGSPMIDGEFTKFTLKSEHIGKIVALCLGDHKFEVEVQTPTPEPTQDIPLQEPSFEVKEEIELPHPHVPNSSRFLMASNEIIEVVEGNEGFPLYGSLLYVFPVDTVITFRNQDGTLIDFFGAWIEEDEKELFELKEITLTSEYLEKTVTLTSATYFFTISVTAKAVDSAPQATPVPEPTPAPETTPTPIPESTPVPEPTPEPTPAPTPEPTPVSVPEPTPAPSMTQSSGTAVVVNCEFLHLRRGAGVSHEAFNHLTVGDTVRVIGQEGNWYHLETDKGTGWAYNTYIEIR